MTRYLAFDIETTKPFPEDHNWRSVRPMGIACAAACGTGDQKAQSLVQPLSKRRDRTRPDPAPGQSLVNQLTALTDPKKTPDPFTLLTWNGLGFDLEVWPEKPLAGFALRQADAFQSYTAW